MIHYYCLDYDNFSCPTNEVVFILRQRIKVIKIKIYFPLEIRIPINIVSKFQKCGNVIAVTFILKTNYFGVSPFHQALKGVLKELIYIQTDQKVSRNGI